MKLPGNHTLSSMLHFFLKSVLGKTLADKILSQLLKKQPIIIGKVFLLRMLAIVISYVITIILTQLLSPSDFGAYSYAMAWVTFLTPVATLGFESLLTREIVAYKTSNQLELLKGLVGHAFITSLLLSVAISLLLFALPFLFDFPREENMQVAWKAAVFLLPLFAMTALFRASLQGGQQIIKAQITGGLLRPLLYVIVLGVVYFAFKDFSGLTFIIALHGAILIINIIYGWQQFSKYLWSFLKDRKKKLQASVWWRAGVAFLILNILGAINSQADVVMLGIMDTSSNVGIYQIAVKLTMAISLLLGIVNFVIAPLISEYYTERKMKELQKIITKSVRGIFVLSIPIVLLLIVFGKPVLSIFGPAYGAGKLAVIILAFGHLTNIFAGSVGNILRMTGNQNYAVISLSIGAVVNIVLNLILIPIYGIEGAAIATAISMIIWNTISSIFVWLKTGIHPTVLGKIRM